MVGLPQATGFDDFRFNFLNAVFDAVLLRDVEETSCRWLVIAFSEEHVRQ